jgi:hypothetical protein
MGSGSGYVFSKSSTDGLTRNFALFADAASRMLYVYATDNLSGGSFRVIPFSVGAYDVFNSAFHAISVVYVSTMTPARVCLTVDGQLVNCTSLASGASLVFGGTLTPLFVGQRPDGVGGSLGLTGSLFDLVAARSAVVDACAVAGGQPCFNGGTCVAMSSTAAHLGFRCDCAFGFSGLLCGNSGNYDLTDRRAGTDVGTVLRGVLDPYGGLNGVFLNGDARVTVNMSAIPTVPSSDGLVFSTWFRLNGSSVFYLVVRSSADFSARYWSIYGEPSARRFSVFYNDGTVVNFRTLAVIPSSVNAFDGGWHHIMLVYGSSSRRLSLVLDGDLVLDQTLTSPAALTSGPSSAMTFVGQRPDSTAGTGGSRGFVGTLYGVYLGVSPVQNVCALAGGNPCSVLRSGRTCQAGGTSLHTGFTCV